MSEKDKNSSQSSDDPLIQVQKAIADFQNSREARKNAAIDEHRQRIKSPEMLVSLYKRYQARESFLLFSEAIPLCFGAEPEHWAAIAEIYGNKPKNIEDLVRSAIGVKLTALNSDKKENEWRVEPKKFLEWLKTKQFTPPSQFFDICGEPIKLKANKSEKPHGNAKRFEANREAVLRAALACVAAFPEKCKRHGKFAGGTIATLIEQKSELWFGYDEIPMKHRAMSDLINEVLKTVQD
jgi:hypothetical protein